MIAYPVLAGALGLDARRPACSSARTIHDVAQVVGAGYSISSEVGDAAVLTKMLRVAMLLPVVMVVGHRRPRIGSTAPAKRGGAIRCCRRSCSRSSLSSSPAAWV